MRPGDFNVPGLPELPGLDRQDPFSDNGRNQDPFRDIVQSIYQPGGPLDLFDRRMNGPNLRNLPIMEVVDHVHDRMDRMMGDTYHARYGRQSAAQGNQYEQLYRPRTSRELMDTLDRHRPFVSDGAYVDKRDLRDYLRDNRDILSPRDRRNLIEVLGNFDRIASSDGRRDSARGISSSDMNAFVEQNRNRDRIIEQRQDRRRPYDRYPDGTPVPDVRRSGDDPRYAPSDRGPRSRYPNDRVMTETDPAHNNHFRVVGENIPLSQEEFKRFYNIPQEIDLLKFMNGKPNDGQVTDFWEAGVAGGLGGRKADGSLKWNDPNYHTLKYDFTRNLQQIQKYSQGMNEHEMKQFMFNFARTQVPVAESNGYKFSKVENETVTASGEGQTSTVDFVQDIGTRNIIQW